MTNKQKGIKKDVFKTKGLKLKCLLEKEIKDIVILNYPAIKELIANGRGN